MMSTQQLLDSRVEAGQFDALGDHTRVIEDPLVIDAFVHESACGNAEDGAGEMGPAFEDPDFVHNIDVN